MEAPMRRTLSCVLAALLVAAVLSAQPQFTTRADLIRVDASVLDRDRRPVRGLTAADFAIREDGRAQTITSFAEVDFDALELEAEDRPVEISPYGEVALLGDHRIIVIVLDDAMLAVGPQVLNSARATARAVVEHMGRRDIAAVVFTRDGRHNQDFTNDRAKLLAAIETLSFGLHDPLMLFSPQRPIRHMEIARGLDSVQTLRDVVIRLRAVPERRKAIVYVSLGVPLDPSARAFADPSDPTARIFDLLTDTFREAAHANVNIYTVNAGGLDDLRAFLERGIPRSSYDFERRRYEEMVRSISTNYRDYLSLIADNTGGHAFVNANDVERRVLEVFQQTGAFYLLGYQTTNPKPDGRFRRVQVRINQRGLTVRARTGYYAPVGSGGSVMGRVVRRQLGSNAESAAQSMSTRLPSAACCGERH
jgi:VWFA-related protein